MCCGVCITRRGMVYFGASIHIFVTLVLFMGSSIRAFRISTYVREDNRKELLGGIIIATYFFILLILGLLIFRATEQKNAKLLGWTNGTFLALEVGAFLFNLAILSSTGGVHDEYGFRNFGFTIDLFHVILSCIFMFFMFAYAGTICMYMKKIKEDGDTNHSDYATYAERDYDEGGVGSSDALSRASSRTPTSFNLRSHSQSQLNEKSDGLQQMSILDVIRAANLKKKQLEQQQQKIPTAKPQQPQIPAQQPLPQPLITQRQSPAPLQSQDDLQNITPASQGPDQVDVIAEIPSQKRLSPSTSPPISHHHTHHHQYSQTLPLRPRERRLPDERQYQFPHSIEYNTRGPTRYPSVPSVQNMATILPSRVRNPPGVRTNAAGTLWGYDPSLNSTGSSGGSRGRVLQRQYPIGSLSSMGDTNHHDYDKHMSITENWPYDEKWVIPNVQVLNKTRDKYNYSPTNNSFGRGARREDVLLSRYGQDRVV